MAVQERTGPTGIQRRTLLLGGAAAAAGLVGAAGWVIGRADRAEAGDVRWSYDGIGFAPLLAGGTLFGTGGGVTALDPATGRERWNFSNDTTGGVSGAHMPSFTPAGDGPVVVAYRSPYLIALNPESGDVAWNYEAGDGQEFTASPVRAADLVVAVSRAPSGTAGAILHGVDAATGTGRWTLPLGEVETSAPVVAGGKVWLSRASGSGTSGGSGAAWLAVDAATGIVALTLSAPISFRNPAALPAGDRVYLPALDRLYGVKAGTGEAGWQADTAMASIVGVGPAGIDDAAPVLVLDDQGGLRAFDQAAGAAPRWSFTETKVTALPALAGDRLYVPAAGGELIVLSAAGGIRQAGHRIGGNDLTGTPVITTDSVLVSDGETLWSVAR
jgi:outer membrane protein assembly factor BamB